MRIRGTTLALSAARLTAGLAAVLAPHAGAAAVDVEPNGTAHLGFPLSTGEGIGVAAAALKGHSAAWTRWVPTTSRRTWRPTVRAARSSRGSSAPPTAASSRPAGEPPTAPWARPGSSPPAFAEARTQAHEHPIEQRAEMAVDAQGGAYFVWVVNVNGKPRVQGRRRAPGGSLSAVQDFGSGYYPMAHPHVAVDPAGNATVAWEKRGPYEVQTRRRSVNGTLGTIHTLSRPGQMSSAVRVAVTADGSARFAWHHFDGAARRVVQARARGANGAFGPVLDVSDPDGWAGTEHEGPPGGRRTLPSPRSPPA